MPTPKAICIEDLNARKGGPRYLRCVALPGRDQGLTLGTKGEVLWKSGTAAACELCVSLDECLILLRPEGAPPVTVTRAGRSIEAPCGKPVVLLGGDEIGVGRRRLRIHVHGPAAAEAAPAPFVPESEPAGAGRFARVAAAAAVLGSAAMAGAVEVRSAPPKIAAPAPPPEPPPVEVRVAPPVPPPPPPPVEVRMAPPVIAVSNAPAPATEIREVVVQQGDTVASIIRRAGGVDSVKDLMTRNRIKDADRLRVGQKLKVKALAPKKE